MYIVSNVVEWVLYTLEALYETEEGTERSVTLRR